MRKKILTFTIILLATLFLGGCSNNNNTSSMTAYTSVYPVEYILENLYGDNIAIYSIYPDGINYKDYKLTDKQLSDYSKGDLYVYNGIIDKEKDYAVNMLNENKKIKIIDASLGMNYSSNTEVAWLNPSNYLMMTSNIKKGLEEYINVSIEIDKINNNYEELKLKLIEIDSNLKSLANNTNNKTIVVGSDSFKFLETYGFTVISLEENENLTDKIIADVKTMFKNKMVSYIFVKDNIENDTIKNIKNEYGAKIISLNSLSTLSVNDRKDKKDYVSIMEDNINSIKLEVNN